MSGNKIFNLSSENKKMRNLFSKEVFEYLEEMERRIQEEIQSSISLNSLSIRKIMLLNKEKTRKVFNWHKEGMVTEIALKYLFKYTLIDKQLFLIWKDDENICCVRCVIYSKKTNSPCQCRISRNCSSNGCSHCGCKGCF